MDIGMLWFDNDKKRSLVEKVLAAAAYYETKYGQKANLVHGHPETVGDVRSVDGIRVVKNQSVLRDHFWVGVFRPSDETLKNLPAVGSSELGEELHDLKLDGQLMLGLEV
jgi:hypothetical protein